jgi:hypothetical protein
MGIRQRPRGGGLAVETVWNASLHIMGSRTFHDMASYWPTSSEVFAPPMNQIPKAVLSTQGPTIIKAVSTRAAELKSDFNKIAARCNLLFL